MTLFHHRCMLIYPIYFGVVELGNSIKCFLHHLPNILHFQFKKKVQIENAIQQHTTEKTGKRFLEQTTYEK